MAINSIFEPFKFRGFDFETGLIRTDHGILCITSLVGRDFNRDVVRDYQDGQLAICDVLCVIGRFNGEIVAIPEEQNVAYCNATPIATLSAELPPPPIARIPVDDDEHWPIINQCGRNTLFAYIGGVLDVLVITSPMYDLGVDGINITCNGYPFARIDVRNGELMLTATSYDSEGFASSVALYTSGVQVSRLTGRNIEITAESHSRANDAYTTRIGSHVFEIPADGLTWEGGRPTSGCNMSVTFQIDAEERHVTVHDAKGWPFRYISL